MGVYGIAVLSFFSNGISKILSLTECAVLQYHEPCGMRFFTLLADGIR